jgi:hypothetical protein
MKQMWPALSDTDFEELLEHVLGTFAKTADDRTYHTVGTELREVIIRCRGHFQPSDRGKPMRTANAGEHAYFDEGLC